jgi:hypothetical protein
MSIRSLLSFFVLIALVFVPVCGMGGMGMAMPVGVQSVEHHVPSVDQTLCADMGDQPADGGETAPDVDCRIMCPAVLAPSAFIGEARAVGSAPQNMAVVTASPGLNPAAEPRPPRLS